MYQNNRRQVAKLDAKAQQKLTVANEIKIDVKNPVPMELGSFPYYSFRGDKYIPFLDRNDNFFKYLLEARLMSVTQSACVATKSNYSIGDGLFVKNVKPEQLDPQLKAFMKYANNKRKPLNSELRRAFDAFNTFGNIPVEIVRMKVGGKRFINMYVKNQLDCRLGWPNKLTGEIEYAIVSKQFRREGIVFLGNDNYIKIPLYKPGPGDKTKYWVKDENNPNVERTMIWITNDIAGYDHYGIPSSFPSIIYQMLEYGGARYNLDNIENNMVVGGALILSGNLSPKEVQRLAKEIKDRHTGPGKRGRVAVFASEQGIQDSKFESFDTHKEGSYNEMDDRVTSKIILSNEWDATLAGLQHANSLGKGNSFISEIYQQKLKTVIRPQQQMILESLIAPLVEIADAWLNTKWSQYEFDIQATTITNDTTEAATTVNGINAFVDIVKMVALGAWPLEAAIKFIAARFGLTEDDARAQLGAIQVNANLNLNTNSNAQSKPNQ